MRKPIRKSKMYHTWLEMAWNRFHQKFWTMVCNTSKYCNCTEINIDRKHNYYRETCGLKTSYVRTYQLQIIAPANNNSKTVMYRFFFVFCYSDVLGCCTNLVTNQSIEFDFSEYSYRRKLKNVFWWSKYEDITGNGTWPVPLINNSYFFFYTLNGSRVFAVSSNRSRRFVIFGWPHWVKNRRNTRGLNDVLILSME